MSTRADSETITLIEAMPSGAVLTLDGVTWEEYEELLRRLGDRPGVRLAYDRGRLEIVSPSPQHEGIAKLFPHLLVALAEECNLNCRSLGSMTMRKRKTLQGVEADECFYFRKTFRSAGKKQFDASVDPPPELAIEVEITSSSMSKFPIFATLEVPEVWRYEDGTVHFYRLTSKEYTEIPHSHIFAFLAPADLARFLRKGETGGVVPMLKSFRKWLRAHKKRVQPRAGA